MQKAKSCSFETKAGDLSENNSIVHCFILWVRWYDQLRTFSNEIQIKFYNEYYFNEQNQIERRVVSLVFLFLKN